MLLEQEKAQRRLLCLYLYVQGLEIWEILELDISQNLLFQ